jgi:hypothetical protein
MSVSQQLAAVLVNLEAEDVTVVTVNTQDHGMKAAGPPTLRRPLHSLRQLINAWRGWGPVAVGPHPRHGCGLCREERHVTRELPRKPARLVRPPASPSRHSTRTSGRAEVGNTMYTIDYCGIEMT